jgi:hypothetical protein
VKIKGNVLLARIAFVKTHFGDDGFQKLLGSFPPPERALYGGTIARAGWYPFETGRVLDDAIVRVLGDGDEHVFEELGAASARENLTTLHKSFIELETPDGFMAKAPIVYGFYYDTGHRTYESTGPGSCVLTTFDADTFSAVDCLTILGWHKQALRMCGAHEVAGSEEKCRAKGDDVCKYVFRWS